MTHPIETGRKGRPGLERVKFVALVCTAAISACSSNQSQTESGTYGDGPPAILAMEEVLRIGDEAAGDTVFFASIENVAVNSRGQIFVLEPRPASVRAFGVDGSYLSNVGAVGEGPGEFSPFLGLGNMLTGPADSIYVYEDLRSRRVLVYDPFTFEFVRSFSVPAYPVEEGTRSENLTLLGVVEDGYLFRLRLVPHGLLVTAHRETTDVIRLVNLDGSYGPVVATGQGYEGVVALREIPQFGQKIPLPNGIPFGRSTKWGLGPDGMLLAGWNDIIDIAVLSDSGVEERRITMDHDPVPVTQAEMDNRMSNHGPDMQNTYRERGLHTTKPAYQELLVDDENRVWLELSITEDSTGVDWLVLDMDSRVVGTASFPLGIDIKAIRHGRVYAVERRADVPTLAVYEFDT